MQNRTYEFDFEDLHVTSSVIESLLGYKEGDDSEIVATLIEEILSECNEIIKVKAEYVVYSDLLFFPVSKSLGVQNVNFNVKNTVYSQLKKSESAALFLCTAGSEIGQKSKHAMSEKDFLKSYVYDVAGSAIVEAAADLMQADLKKNALVEGNKITNRFSPGYCGWDVAEQHKLFSLILDNYCGITLTPSALMDPVKSVSGIIGIGKNVKYNPYTCRMCNMKDCIYSRMKETLNK